MQRILSGLVILLILTSCTTKGVANYDIKPSDNGKLHPIIKIFNTETGGSCSAFVISDNLAMTAAHCVEKTEEFIQEILPKIFANSNRKLKELRKEILNIKENCRAPFQCEAFLNRVQSMIDAELAGQMIAKTWKADIFNLTDSNGNELKIKAIAHKQSYQRDYAFIRGDFSNFNKLKIKRTFDAKVGDSMKACGFPGAKIPAVCIDFIAVGQIDFMYSGSSMFVPGISGGPVIDYTGEVVGICSRVQGPVSIFEPTLGTVSEKQ